MPSGDLRSAIWDLRALLASPHLQPVARGRYSVVVRILVSALLLAFTALPLAASASEAGIDATAWARAASRAEAEGRYADAATLYAGIVEKAPNSYAVRTAESRMKVLANYTDYDFEPYRRFESLKRRYADMGSDAGVEAARQIIADFPHAVVTPEVQFWLGNEFREIRGDEAAAMVEYRRVVESWPDHRLAPIALDRIARMHEAAGRLKEAAGVYGELRQRYPAATSPEKYDRREAELQLANRRHQMYLASLGILGLAAVAFLAVGGWRIDFREWLRRSLPLAGFAFLVGLIPAATLSVVGEMWSPSLTAMGFSFAAYAFVLGALGARRRWPSQALIPLEKLIFKAAVPLALIYLIVHKFEYWVVFGL